MAAPTIGAGKLGAEIINTLRDMQREQQRMGGETAGQKEPGMSFTDHLAQGIKDVNQKSKVADKLGMELATGRTDNLHETMLAATQAELSFNLMVQLRNKALEAYTDVMKMPV